MPHHPRRFAPDRISDGWIKRLHQNPIPAARVPDEVGGGGPGDVAHVLRGEAPCQRHGPRATCGATRGLSDFVLGDDRDRRIGVERACKPFALLRGQHLERVHQPAGSRDDEAARDGNGEIDVAILEIELTLAEILLGVPAAHVVVDGEPRIPLRDLVQPAFRKPFAPHAIRAVLGHLERVADLERCDGAGRQGAIELDAHDCSVLACP